MDGWWSLIYRKSFLYDDTICNISLTSHIKIGCMWIHGADLIAGNTFILPFVSFLRFLDQQRSWYVTKRDQACSSVSQCVRVREPKDVREVRERERGGICELMECLELGSGMWSVKSMVDRVGVCLRLYSFKQWNGHQACPSMDQKTWERWEREKGGMPEMLVCIRNYGW